MNTRETEPATQRLTFIDRRKIENKQIRAVAILFLLFSVPAFFLTPESFVRPQGYYSIFITPALLLLLLIVQIRAKIKGIRFGEYRVYRVLHLTIFGYLLVAGLVLVMSFIPILRNL